MPRNQNFIIVEDREQDARTLQEVLVDLGFEPMNCLATVASASAARDEIKRNLGHLDLVFLDLNIAEAGDGSRIDNDVGYEILVWIHTDLNRTNPRKLRVVIVSGQYDLRGIPDRTFRSGYEGTLVGVVHKENLKGNLNEVLVELERDSLFQDLVASELDCLKEYQELVRPGTPVNKKCQAAKRIACRVLMNEGDYRRGAVGVCQYGDDLNKAIKEIIESRFKPDVGGRRYVKKNNMVAGDSWEHFLWRGAMHEHFYGINNYRNRNEHLPDHDYSYNPPSKDEWKIPSDVLEYFTRGEDVGEIAALQVKAILRWYLPWHKQIFLPWSKTQSEKKAQPK